MAKGGMDAFGSGKGMSPRKAMASGMADISGDKGFGVTGYPGSMNKPHPDHMAGTGSAGAMDDGERAIGGPIHHAKGHLPAQAAPHHGPHLEGELGFDREPSKGY
jgi:hypothetical protein